MKLPAILPGLLGLLSTTGVTARDADEFSASDVAGPDGLVDAHEAATYAFLLNHPELLQHHRLGFLRFDPTKAPQQVRDQVVDIEDDLGSPPWSASALDQTYGKKPTGTGDAWREIEGITKVKTLDATTRRRSIGPFQLRRNKDDLNGKLQSSTKGATLAFSNDFDSKAGDLWSSEGIFYYPFNSGCEYGSGSSLDLQLGPALAWKLAGTKEPGKEDVEELSMAVPFIAYYTPPGTDPSPRTDSLAAIWVFKGSPYYQTDFSLEHRIWGADLSAEYVGTIFGGRLALGDFMNTGIENLQYKLRAVPKVDYSETDRGGPHTTRTKGDDWLRVGGLMSFDLRMGTTFGNVLEVGLSYEGLETISGSGGYSSLFRARTAWWLNEYMGLNLEYSKGDTPVSAKKVDTITLGTEFRY